MRSPLRVRSLTPDELAFEWREQNLSELDADARDVLASVWVEQHNSSSLPDQQQAFVLERRALGIQQRPTALPFSIYRAGNCAASRAFGRALNIPCLISPKLKNWRTALAGRTVGFIGDSVLRDLFVYMSLTFSPVTPHSFVGISRSHFGSDTAGGSSFASAHFAEGPDRVSFVWCHHGDDVCVRRRLQTADVLVLAVGAHCTPLVSNPHVCTLLHGWPYDACHGHREGLDTCNPSMNRSAVSEVSELAHRMHVRSALIFFEYPPSHFQWGLGEFEDRQVAMKDPNRWGAFPRPAMPAHSLCRPLGPCLSAVARWRRGLSSRFHAAGVPVLPTWDIGADQFENHPAAAGGLGYSPGAHQGIGPDCRHSCNPSAVVRAWS